MIFFPFYGRQKVNIIRKNPTFPPHFLLFRTFCSRIPHFPEYNQPLTQVIAAGEQPHSDQHGHIFLHAVPHIGHEPDDQGLCHAKGKGIAKEDIGGKPHGLPHTPLMVVEGEILVGKEADDAGDAARGDRAKGGKRS